LLHNRILKDSSFEQNQEKIEDLLTAETELSVAASSHPTMSQPYNPYDLSSGSYGQYDDTSSRVSRQFNSSLNVARNTDYYFYLRRTYSFWFDYLPGLYKNYQDRSGRASSEQDRLLENGELRLKT